MSAAPRRTGLRQLHPEAARGWVAFAPKRWPATSGPWTDIAGGRLRGLGTSSPRELYIPELPLTSVDDLIYLPPVDGELEAARRECVGKFRQSGAPVLVQRVPGEDAAQVGAGSESSGDAESDVVFDLLRPLLARDLDLLAAVPAGGWALWPLIAGLTADPDLWEDGCRRLVTAGARCVLPLTVELEPSDRRILAELGGAHLFDELFHGEPPSERDFARCAARHGLTVFPERPGGGFLEKHARNRQLASELALAGELWLRLGRSVSQGQALLQSARAADRAPQDLAALSREGNLGVLDWVDATGREILDQWVEHGSSKLLEALLEEYVND